VSAWNFLQIQRRIAEIDVVFGNFNEKFVCRMRVFNVSILETVWGCRTHINPFRFNGRAGSQLGAGQFFDIYFQFIKHSLLVFMDICLTQALWIVGRKGTLTSDSLFGLANLGSKLQCQ
jgi:hypothetical protein